MENNEFIKYLESKNFAKKTQYECLLNVKQFFDWTEKEDIQVAKPDILKYLEHLKNKGLQNMTRKHYLTNISHYFSFLYENEKITENPCLFLKIRGTNKKTLHKIYTPEELEQLFDNYYQYFVRNYDDSKQRHALSKQRSALGRERNAVILSILINQAVTTTEIGKIEINDLDLLKATIKIRGKEAKLNDRTVPLKATQIGLIMNYLHNIRPRFLEYQTENNKLFLSLGIINKKNTEKSTEKSELRDIFGTFADQIRTIDKQFLNFTQIRISLITFWIKTHGLRKAQYLAGHRNISTTEQYLPNNLENLIDDINKLHPF